MPDKDNLDLLLDSALATYADPGPHSGLEARVLAAVASEPSPTLRPRTPTRWLPWAIAVPLAASLLLWLSLGRQQPYQRQRPSMEATRPADRPEALNSEASTNRGKAQTGNGFVTGHDFSRAGNSQKAPRALAPEGRRPAATEAGNHPAPPPKLDVFPSPQPLTPEEQALAAAARTPNRAEREALIAAQTPSDAPLDIAALTIPPLAAPREGQK